MSSSSSSSTPTPTRGYPPAYGPFREHAAAAARSGGKSHLTPMEEYQFARVSRRMRSDECHANPSIIARPL